MRKSVDSYYAVLYVVKYPAVMHCTGLVSKILVCKVTTGGHEVMLYQWPDFLTEKAL